MTAAITREQVQLWIILLFSMTICLVVVMTAVVWGVHGEAPSPEATALRSRMYDVVLFMLGVIGSWVSARTEKG